jgi:hypothetical protein
VNRSGKQKGVTGRTRHEGSPKTEEEWPQQSTQGAKEDTKEKADAATEDNREKTEAATD